MEETSVHLYVDVPFASYTTAYSRYFLETYPLAPPSTVYGMLLSLIGEYNMRKYIGTEISIALISNPSKFKHIRTWHRYKDNKSAIGTGKNVIPKSIECLWDNKYSIWIRQGKSEHNKISLCSQIKSYFDKTNIFPRQGVLSCGCSDNMINDISIWKNDNSKGKILTISDMADLSMPVWVDHLNNKNTVYWKPCKLMECNPNEYPNENCWIPISSK